MEVGDVPELVDRLDKAGSGMLSLSSTSPSVSIAAALITVCRAVATGSARITREPPVVCATLLHLFATAATPDGAFA